MLQRIVFILFLVLLGSCRTSTYIEAESHDVRHSSDSARQSSVSVQHVAEALRDTFYFYQMGDTVRIREVSRHYYHDTVVVHDTVVRYVTQYTAVSDVQQKQVVKTKRSRLTAVLFVIFLTLSAAGVLWYIIKNNIGVLNRKK